ncbi:hypothetical protein, partial [Escherichia coli]|uniref:hypothetical protein n=1 Tax=Escherichia coli TaxID=562 RepID=UPI0018E10428|nr:hypothetical protein [Escherichia coli]
GRDAFAAIEAVMSWDSFAESVTEAQKLAQPDDFDFLHRIGESYATLRRYAPEFLAGHCCKVSDEAAFCLIQRPYISKTLLTRRISPRGSP